MTAPGRSRLLPSRLTIGGLLILSIFLVYVVGSASTPARRRSPARRLLPLRELPADARGILFRSTVADDSFERLVFLPIDRLDGDWAVAPMSCARVHFQAGAGLCLTAVASRTRPYALQVFNRHFVAGERRGLTGSPSRARVSPDGRRAALTSFEAGESYAERGRTTRTLLIDTVSNAILSDFEDFHLSRDGRRVDLADLNVWGVTFEGDSNGFYATLELDGTPWLIHGDVDRREARLLRPGIECPSLSPDGRRIAFKRRVDGVPGVAWHAAILDLATSTVRVLVAESRSVDDQIEWLDDRHVLYHLASSQGADIWVLRTDAPEPPRILIPGGYSPSVLR